MHPVIKTLKNGLSYAKFQDRGIKDAVDCLVNELGSNLAPGDLDYEESDEVKKMADQLEEAISEYDEQGDAIDDVIGHSKVVDEGEDA